MSLNGSMCLKDTGGALMTTLVDTDAPAGFNGGTPMVPDRRITVTALSTGLSKVAGLAYDSAGRLAVVGAGPVTAWVAGVPVDIAGRVFYENASPMFWSQDGIPITAGGAVAIRSGVGPGDMFRNGEQGVWYDPSDFNTMFKDTAGTLPVAAVGDPVGKILDKSGNGNHLTLTGGSSLQQDAGGYFYLDLPSSSSGVTAPINFTATDKLTVWSGLQA